MLVIVNFKYLSILNSILIAQSKLNVFLGWAADDAITNNWEVANWKDKYKFTTFEISTGGHVVSSAYADAILNFLIK